MRWQPQAEITLEANPDDLSAAKLRELAGAGINRLSIGLQSFYEPHLRLMNRAHTAEESTTAVRRAQDAGFENISIDLIYGVPAPGHHIWEADLANAFALGVPHVSAYALTIEPGTAFGHRLQKGTFRPAPDEFVATQFEMLLAAMRAHGYAQYEISNFCQPGRESRHNGNYWRGVPYLGLGPSAHSYDGQQPPVHPGQQPAVRGRRAGARRSARHPRPAHAPPTAPTSTCSPPCAPPGAATWPTCAPTTASTCPPPAPPTWPSCRPTAGPPFSTKCLP